MAVRSASQRQRARSGAGKGRYKSAITGRFVTSRYGKRHPRTTYKLGD